MSDFVVSDTGKPTIQKDPNAVLDYSIDLTDWLGTDSLALVEASVVGVTINRPATFAGKVVTAWVAGGVDGETGSLTFHFVTAAGREDDRTLYFRIKER